MYTKRWSFFSGSHTYEYSELETLSGVKQCLGQYMLVCSSPQIHGSLCWVPSVCSTTDDKNPEYCWKIYAFAPSSGWCCLGTEVRTKIYLYVIGSSYSYTEDSLNYAKCIIYLRVNPKLLLYWSQCAECRHCFMELLQLFLATHKVHYNINKLLWQQKVTTTTTARHHNAWWVVDADYSQWELWQSEQTLPPPYLPVHQH